MTLWVSAIWRFLRDSAFSAFAFASCVCLGFLGWLGSLRCWWAEKKVCGGFGLTDLISELRERFGVSSIAGLGVCIVIHGEELDLDWILAFFEQKHRFEGTFLDGHPVLLVQLEASAQ